jgi:hypothetical protein
LPPSWWLRYRTPQHRCTRIALTARRNTEDNTMTSERLKAQGKSIKRPLLTGSLLQNS